MLRNYQLDAINAIRTSFKNGVSRQVVSMCTGSGKTQIFSHLPERLKDILGGQTLVLAHREELIDQAIEKLYAANPSLSIGKEMANYKADATNDIIVASVATLGRKNTDRVNKFNWNNIGTVVTDECHHSSAQSYRNIYEMADVLRPDTHKLHVGFTATPQRSDGSGLSEIYSQVVYNYPIRTAIEDGWLCDIKGIRVNTKLSLDNVHTKAGDFDQNELSETVNTPERNVLIVKAWLENAKNFQTVVFTVDIQHAKDLAKVFQDNGVKCEALWGNDPDRADKILKHKEGVLTVLTNCAVLTEGYDDPAISCIILARPTKSGVLFTQCVGRGTRIFAGKSGLLVIDIVDSTLRHSLVTVTSLLGLPKDLDLKGKSLIKSLNDVEKMQLEFPTVDFSTLKDLDKIEAFIEAVNLWEVKFLPEVQEHSAFTWYPSITGGYSLTLGENDSIKIEQNLLDFWELRGKIKGKTYKGERASLAEAFSAADKLVQNVAGDSLTLVKREAPWHNLPATKGQLWRIRRIHKGKKIPLTLTRGMAAKIIGAAKAGKG